MHKAGTKNPDRMGTEMNAINYGTVIVNADTGQRVGSAATEYEARYVASAMNAEHTDIRVSS